MPIITCKIIEVCIFKFEDDRPWYLLLHRAKNEKIYPDIWQFVSGSIEGDEKATDAAYRELQEETGLKPKAFWVVPFVNSFYDPGWDAVNLSPLFAAQVPPGDEPTLSHEHDECGWYLFEDAVRKLVWPGQREGIRIVHDYIVKGEKAAKLTRIR
ncbi:MAG: NUDIX pyrophosphatase [Ignavibacteria bacterium]|nr:NUDIX pyrophosphatase [Ignavibacteria bacterium]MBI3766457.1 NUDIX pyrophosphatase [Ignavibacteriales bacterium]